MNVNLKTMTELYKNAKTCYSSIGRFRNLTFNDQYFRILMDTGQTSEVELFGVKKTVPVVRIVEIHMN